MNNANLMQETSEKFDVVIKHLMQAKREMGSSVKKDATNPFHKSKYATLGAHLELCEATLDKHGLIMLQTINGQHDKAILVATLCHAESGQWIKSYLPLPNPKGDSQGLGASITYMRRYSINSMLGLNAEDDDGEGACLRPKPESKAKHVALDQKQEPQKIDIEKINPDEISQLATITNQLNRENISAFLNWLKEKYDCSLNTIPKSAFQTCFTVLNAKLKQQNQKVA